jgi:starch synthase
VRILMVTTELVPLAKVGGLGDAVAALSKALRSLGHDVRCALPRYSEVVPRLEAAASERARSVVALDLPSGREEAVLARWEGEGLPAPVQAVHHPLFDRPGVYDDPETRIGWPDNGTRWAVFCRAVHAGLGLDGWVPEVVHAHDHQAAPMTALLRWGPWPVSLPRRPATVFTIHNLGYQGLEPPSWLPISGLPSHLFHPAGPAEYHGRVSLMKLGLESADRLTTVSPRYAEEIATDPEFGCGLEGVLARRRGDLEGILNGIDTEVWNPAVDPHLPFRYTRSRSPNKAKDRLALREEMGLAAPRPEVPLVGMVGRLTAQKGLDLLLAVLDVILGDGLQMAILGTGDGRYEEALGEAAARHPGRLSVRIGFDEGLAHRIEAGSDIFLMPSRYEPCGLNQMYSLRYGTVPVVRAVGGLADTVVDLDEDPERANGFVFRLYEPVELLKTVRRAARAWRDRRLWAGLQARGMSADFSWRASARRYEGVYEGALGMPG